MDTTIEPSTAKAISGDGSKIVGYFNTPNASSARAFICSGSGGTLTDLGYPPGYSNAWAVGVSHDGSKVLGGSSSLVASIAWTWTSGDGFAELPYPGAGYNQATPMCFSSDGVSAGGTSYIYAPSDPSAPADSMRAVLWNNVGCQAIDLPSLFPGLLGNNNAVTMTAINSNGAFLAGNAQFEPGLSWVVYGVFELSCGAATADYITAQWTAPPGGPYTYSFRWRIAGTTDWTVVPHLTATSYAVTGLTAGQTVEWAVAIEPADSAHVHLEGVLRARMAGRVLATYT